MTLKFYSDLEKQTKLLTSVPGGVGGCPSQWRVPTHHKRPIRAASEKGSALAVRVLHFPPCLRQHFAPF